MITLHFVKYQALGNDYLVFETDELGDRLTPALVRQICDRHFGVGSDGVLVRVSKPGELHAVRIFNPDGSEAEKSGNGLRIFARYLWDKGIVETDSFRMQTGGGLVACRVMEDGRIVEVEMGRVSFDSADISVSGPKREVLREKLVVAGQTLEFSAATIGNPHCVILQNEISEAEVRVLGPLIETHPIFPNRTNVQFIEVLDRQHIRLEIWERGAGFTLASGSSSCAAAAVAHRLGLVDAEISVSMPGGEVSVEVGEDYQMRLIGPVARIFAGEFQPDR
ncbi:MAG: diaminopimelate epimerase [Caldilineales bacterium]|nr:diaminopimelate epimerase [Caldilineales bacterium]